jgi:hypothetical protein
MEISGHIAAIQEERIRVVGDDGRIYLFTLPPDSDATDIRGLQERSAHVGIRFQGQPDMDTGVVEEIEEIPAAIPEVQPFESVILSGASAL